MKTNKPPLYRKVSKTTHNGFEHADYGYNERSSHARHTKKGMKRGMATQHVRGNRKLHDYTPLFKFLLKQEGRDWDEVWQECVARLDSTEPVLCMVINIRNNGLVRDDFEIDTEESFVDFKGRRVQFHKSFCYGEGSSYSTMYVDKNNKLQFVDKNYVTGPNYECERRWGETFNGRLYETYKRPQKKVEKMKSYIKKDGEN